MNKGNFLNSPEISFPQIPCGRCWLGEEQKNMALLFLKTSMGSSAWSSESRSKSGESHHATKFATRHPWRQIFNPSGRCYLMTWMSEVTDVPRQMYQASALVWRFMCPWLAFTNKVSCPLPAPVSCNVVTVSSSVSSPGPECCICSQKDEESSGPFWLFCAVAAPKKDFSQDYTEWERWGELYTLKSKCWAGLCYWNFEGSCLLHQQICALYLDWC